MGVPPSTVWIKIDMKIQDITESVSPILYHATSFHGANEILQNDFIKGPEISFARSLQGSYHKSNRLIGVIFQFDGNMLNYKYKGGPVGTENWDYDPDEYDPDDKFTWSHTGKDNGQLEDRVYAKDGMEKATRYIVNAIIYAPIEYVREGTYDEFEDRTYPEQIKSIVTVLRQLEAQNIPYRYVASEKDLSGRKNDKEGFSKVIKFMYKNMSGHTPYSDKNFTPDIKKEFDVGNNWILYFEDYSQYDPDNPHSIHQVTKEFKGTREDAIQYGRKLSTNDLVLFGISGTDSSDDYTDL